MISDLASLIYNFFTYNLLFITMLTGIEKMKIMYSTVYAKKKATAIKKATPHIFGFVYFKFRTVLPG